MSSEQANRLIQTMGELGLSQADLARKVGVTPVYVNAIVRGRTGVTLKFADRLRSAVGLSPYYILFGEGPVQAAVAKARLDVDPRVVSDAAVGEDGAFYTTLRPLRVPLMGRVSANPNPDVIWEPVDPPEYRELPKGAVALEVRGDSMRPVAMPGQAVIAVELPIANGDLAAVAAEQTSRMRLTTRFIVNPPRKALRSPSTRAGNPSASRARAARWPRGGRSPG